MHSSQRSNHTVASSQKYSSRADGSCITDVDGRNYIDFLAGAGALNYGHNNPNIKEKILNYIASGGIIHSLDLYTVAKEEFLEQLANTILIPQKLEYKVQFTGPTGTNAVEAALKLARKVTGRASVGAFTNGYHGLTLGALAATGNSLTRKGAGQPLVNVTRFPFDNYLGNNFNTLEMIEKLINDPGSGVEKPAAFLIETVQGEGGLNVASAKWLRGLANLAKESGTLLIVDDIQAGCGRTGTFFSFEDAGIRPDIVCLSKSISGFGLPMAILLIKPDLDIWQAGEHTGTFRGNNLAFVGATAALEFWQDKTFTDELEVKIALMKERLLKIHERFAYRNLNLRGRGMMQGINFGSSNLAKEVSQLAFSKGLIVETCGPYGEVVKLMPSLTIKDHELTNGLYILEESISEVFSSVEQKAS